MERRFPCNIHDNRWQSLGCCYVQECWIFGPGILLLESTLVFVNYVLLSFFFEEYSFAHFCILIWKYKVVELDFVYPSEGIHRRWESGYRITSMAATADQAAFILSIPKRKLMDETQETLRTSAFPSSHVKVRNCVSRVSFLLFFIIWGSKVLAYHHRWEVLLSRHIHDNFHRRWILRNLGCLFGLFMQEKWSKNLYIASICYGRTVC